MSQKARPETGRNPTAVATIVPSRKTISISAIPGRRRAKNNPDQATFSANWPKNRARANLAPFHPAFSQTSQALVAIKKYRADQTGAKIQLGELTEGFLRSAYHVPTEDDVHSEPSAAAPSHKNRNKRSMSQRLSDMASLQLSHLLDVLMAVEFL